MVQEEFIIDGYFRERYEGPDIQGVSGQNNSGALVTWEKLETYDCDGDEIKLGNLMFQPVDEKGNKIGEKVQVNVCSYLDKDRGFDSIDVLPLNGGGV